MPVDTSKRFAALALSISMVIGISGSGFAQNPPAGGNGNGKVSDSDFLKDYDKVVVPQSTENNAARDLEKTPKAPAHPAASSGGSVMLKGRLEEVSGNGANLPVGLLLGLKAQKAKVDPSLQPKPKADPLKGMLASYPLDWAGPWGGSLSIWWTQIDPLYWQWDPENAKATAEVLRKGASGTTTFYFTQNKNSILVEAPKIHFPPRQSVTPTQAPNPNNMMATMQALLLQSLTPTVILGNYDGQGLPGTYLSQRIVKDTIKQLKPGVLEQDVVCQTSERHKDNSVKSGYFETIYRFTKLNPNQLYVQAATVNYRNDGHFLDKTIFYGTLNKGQVMPDPSANPFAGMPNMPGMGSFPGMPTSPGGSGMPQGLDGLNDVIRELQKGLGQ